MKKSLPFKLLLLSIPVSGIFLLNSNAAGPVGGYTGSPGDVINCTNCHIDSGADFGTAASITTTIPPEGYVPGQTYQVTVSVTSVATRHGFQITAEEDATDTKVGTWASIDGNTQVTGGDHVSHTFAGNNLMSWTMDWTAPATDEGTITFYAAVNAASNSAGPANDQIVTTSSSHNVNVLSTEDVIFAGLSLYPNPVMESLQLELPSTIAQATVTVYNHLGKELLNTTVNKEHSALQVSHLQNGIYMLAIHADGKRTTKSFVKR